MPRQGIASTTKSAVVHTAPSQSAAAQKPWVIRTCSRPVNWKKTKTAGVGEVSSAAITSPRNTSERDGARSRAIHLQKCRAVAPTTGTNKHTHRRPQATHQSL